MLDTMYAAPGIGLAAVQVGILKRVVVVDISKEARKNEPIYLINPEIIWKSDILEKNKKAAYQFQIILPILKDPMLVTSNTLMSMEKRNC